MKTYPKRHASDPAHYVSFVLRCWSGEGSHVRARLIEVPSGISHPLADLRDLADLVRYLFERDEMDDGEAFGASSGPLEPGEAPVTANPGLIGHR